MAMGRLLLLCFQRTHVRRIPADSVCSMLLLLLLARSNRFALFYPIGCVSSILGRSTFSLMHHEPWLSNPPTRHRDRRLPTQNYKIRRSDTHVLFQPQMAAAAAAAAAPGRPGSSTSTLLAAIVLLLLLCGGQAFQPRQQPGALALSLSLDR